MLDIALICAIAENDAIGMNNDLPWRLKGELALFKKITRGHAVIMGRKTYESLPKRPLPERHNIVISRKKIALEGATMVGSLPEAMQAANDHPQYAQNPAMVIGGAEIFRLAYPYAKFYYRTMVAASPKADVFFRDFRMQDWQIDSVIAQQEASADSAGYRTEKWQRLSGLEYL